MSSDDDSPFGGDKLGGGGAPPFRERRRTVKARRLRVPVDEVPRPSLEVVDDDARLSEEDLVSDPTGIQVAPRPASGFPPPPPRPLSAIPPPMPAMSPAPAVAPTPAMTPAEVPARAESKPATVPPPRPEPAPPPSLPDLPAGVIVGAPVVVVRASVSVGVPAAESSTMTSERRGIEAPAARETTSSEEGGVEPEILEHFDQRSSDPDLQTKPQPTDPFAPAPRLTPFPSDEQSTEITIEESSDLGVFEGDDVDPLAGERTLVREPEAELAPIDPVVTARTTLSELEAPSIIIDASALTAALREQADSASSGEASAVVASTTVASAMEASATVASATAPAEEPTAEPPARDSVPEEAPEALEDLGEVEPVVEVVAKAAPPKAPPKSVAPAPPPQAIAAPAVVEPPAEPKKKKRTRAWWEDFFNDDYLRTVRPPKEAQVARQVDFIESSFALAKGATILDVGCGLGLHSVELAARGYTVVGLDYSLAMLSRAADEAQDRGLKINFLHADLREMTFDGAFDAVLCWGTTFGYFDDETNKQVLSRLHRALKPEGLLMLDVVNRDFVVPGQPNLVWFEGDGCLCMEETQVNYITSRLHVKRTVILDDGRQRDAEYSVRLYSLHELGQTLHHMGFRVAELSGREATPGVFFGAASPRLIILAQRRAESSMVTGEMPRPPGVTSKPPESVPAGAQPPPPEEPK